MLILFNPSTLGQRPTILILTYNALQLGPFKILAFTKIRSKLTYKGCFAVGLPKILASLPIWDLNQLE